MRAAEAYFRYASDDQKPELARNILEKAAEYGVRVESPEVLSWAGKARSSGIPKSELLSSLRSSASNRSDSTGFINYKVLK